MITYPNVKINIGLNVLNRRDDGFHNLETLFWPYDGITDVLEIVASDDFSRTASCLVGHYGGNESEFCGDVSLTPQIRQAVTPDGKLMITVARKEGVDWAPEKDLCAKAYFMLADDFPSLPSVKIYLEKRSPVGAGLGGGSADAAFALVMLNEMFSLGLSRRQLASYASRLGSDCAFFVYDRPMFGEGRGEVLSDFDGSILDGYRIRLLVPPGISVSTAEAYRGIVPRIPPVPLRDLLKSPIETWRDRLCNDFETSVFASHPELAELKSRLYAEGAVYASMSGSGSSLFGIFRK